MIQACKTDPHLGGGGPVDPIDSTWVYDPQPYMWDQDILTYFPPIPPVNYNPTTVQGVNLGRRLFYDPILSTDSSLSCGTCHSPAFNFTDNGKLFSDNIAGPTTRNSMPLINLQWHQRFMWDFRSETLEDGVLDALENEQHFDAINEVAKLENITEYRKWFYEAFGDTTITEQQVVYAISQFLRTMVSYNSKYDRVIRGEASFTVDEQFAIDSIFLTPKGDCFHCHQTFPAAITSTILPRNNGLQFAPDYTYYDDIGFGILNPANLSWYGRFKVPELRNLTMSYPYMHDGRIPNLDSLINFYSDGVHIDPADNYNIDPNMAADYIGDFNAYEKKALKDLLLTMVDSTFINDTAFQNPW